MTICCVACTEGSRQLIFCLVRPKTRITVTQLTPLRFATVTAAAHFLVFQPLFAIYRMAPYPVQVALSDFVFALIWPAPLLIYQIYNLADTLMYPAAVIPVAIGSATWFAVALVLWPVLKRRLARRSLFGRTPVRRKTVFGVACFLLAWLFFGPLGEIPGDIAFGMLSIGHLPSGAQLISPSRLAASVALCAICIYAARRLILDADDGLLSQAKA